VSDGDPDLAAFLMSSSVSALGDATSDMRAIATPARSVFMVTYCLTISSGRSLPKYFLLRSFSRRS